jgi:hypothetical protein
MFGSELLAIEVKRGSQKQKKARHVRVGRGGIVKVQVLCFVAICVKDRMAR